MSQDSRVLPDDRQKGRHASGSHRGPDKELLESAGLIVLFMLLYGGFFAALATFAGI